MKITFKNKHLKDICESNKKACRELGKECAKKLMRRLADMNAASVVKELVAGSPHALKGDRQGQYSLRLQGGNRLVFEPNHINVPLTKDGSIDWWKVSKVRVIFIGDYHG